MEDDSELVMKRIKVIKLANKNEFGWLTVREYLSNKLASDKDNKKQIFWSEKRAERKLKEKQRLKRCKQPHYQPPPSTKIIAENIDKFSMHSLKSGVTSNPRC